MMQRYLGLSIGLLALGVISAIYGGSVLPMFVVVAVIATVGFFVSGFSKGTRK